MKKFFQIFSYYFFVFLILGFILHTSSHPTVLGKYTIFYAIFLCFLFLLFLPYQRLVQFTFKTSLFKRQKKTYAIHPYQKVLIYCFVFVFFVLLPIEITLRVLNFHFEKVPGTYTIANFHPFLQHQLIPQMGTLYHANKYGFRANDIQKEKSKKTYRIFLLGGSTVLNLDAPFEKNVSEQLRKLLMKDFPDKQIEVINAGNEGYTSEHSLIDYLYKISDFKPDLIIMWHGINDMAYACVPSPYTYGPYKQDYSHYLGSVTNMVQGYYSEKPIIDVHLVLTDFITHFFTNNFYSDIVSYYQTKIKKTNTLPRDIQPITKEFQSITAYKRNLQYLIKVITGDNVKLFVGDQPYLYTQNADIKTTWYMQQLCSDGKHYPSLASLIKGINAFNTVTKEVSDENHIPFINLAQQIPKTTEFFADDVHLTEKGNQLLGQILYDFIKQEDIIH